MSELKPKFIELTKIALIEFALSHPGCKVSAKILESAYDISEEDIASAYEFYGSFSPAIDEYIKYMFTGGRNGFKKPQWLS